jgi:AraC-like DNA-binding protein
MQRRAAALTVAGPAGDAPLWHERPQARVWDLTRGREDVSTNYTTFITHEAPGFEMHRALEFGMLVAGRIRRFCGGYEYLISPGEAWFQGAFEPHTYETVMLPTVALSFGALPEAVAAVGLEEATPYDWMAPFTVPPEARPRTLPHVRKDLLQLAAKVTGLGRFAPSERAAWRRLLFFEMMLLAREGWTPPTPHRLSSSSYDRIGEAIALVLSSQEPVSVVEAAKACNLSRNAFGRIFRTATGSTFARYCLLHRLGTAAQQLLATDKPIKAIAAEWGFASASHFGECFRKHYRCSPAEYRQERLTSITGAYRSR